MSRTEWTGAAAETEHTQHTTANTYKQVAEIAEMLTPSVQLEKVGFAYGVGKPPVFHDVSFKIAPKARVVLVCGQSHP